MTLQVNKKKALSTQAMTFYLFTSKAPFTHQFQNTGKVCHIINQDNKDTHYKYP